MKADDFGLDRFGLDDYRGRYYRSLPVQPEGRDVVGDSVSSRVTLQQLLDDLPPELQQLAQLVWEEYSERAIADEMALGRTVVRRLLRELEHAAELHRNDWGLG